jgi:hypothetical protein
LFDKRTLAALAALLSLIAGPGLAGGARSGLSEERPAARNGVDEKPAAALASEKQSVQQTASLTTKRSNEIDEAIDKNCSMVETAAAANRLPLEFFARVIWHESRFRLNTLGPMTRSGQRAQGIAQFMPDTAARRGLLDPFDAQKALPEAAKFLAELRSEFGNLGLAAAAYNAGPHRVRQFIGRRSDLPNQTRHYVRAITGHSVDKWATLGREKDGFVKPTSCVQLTSLLKEQAKFRIGRVDRKVREASLQRKKAPGLTTASVENSRIPAPRPQSLIAPDRYVLQPVLSTPDVPTPKPKPSTAQADTSSTALKTSKIASVTRQRSASKTTSLRSGSPDEELSISYSPYPRSLSISPYPRSRPL